ncbi:MAG: iron-sulfur cluster assembly protein [Planctomycetota bacterium]|nr:iron-sulfur cluster assembly protein [Planctomycetota bacterium]
MTDQTDMQTQIMEALSTIYDPEIPIDIVALGLIYGVDIEEGKDVTVSMSLTSPSCPSAAEIPADCEKKVQALEAVESVTVNVVWDPPWGPEMISPEGRKTMGMDADDEDEE